MDPHPAAATLPSRGREICGAVFRLTPATLLLRSMSPRNPMSPRDILLALIVVFVWGLSFIAIKWGVELVPPLLLTALRYTFAALPAVFFIKPPKVKLSILLAYGISIGVLQFGTVFVAIKLGMPAGLSSLVIQMQAFFTIGLAALFLGERLSRFQTIGAAIALLGI